MYLHHEYAEKTHVHSRPISPSRKNHRNRKLKKFTTIKNMKISSRIRIAFLLSLFAGQLMAQDADPVLATINYEFVHTNDTNDRENPYKEEMVVYIGQHSSVYKNRSLGDLIERNKLSSGSNYNRLNFNRTGDHISQGEFYLYAKEKRAFWIESDYGLRTHFLIKADFPAIDWRIEDEVKEIGGYSCQKAIGAFGGRIYSVWFTSEIPVPYGPWKLHGLPGLILQAEDNKREVIFTYQGFDKAQHKRMSIEIPRNTVITTFDKLNRTQNAFADNESLKGSDGNMVRYNAENKELTEAEFAAGKEENKRNREKRMSKMNNPLELN